MSCERITRPRGDRRIGRSRCRTRPARSGRPRPSSTPDQSGPAVHERVHAASTKPGRHAPPPRRTDSERLRKAVKTPRIVAHLRQLQAAADRYGDRAAGHEGYNAASRYVESRLRAAGYTPRRQYFDFVYTRVNANTFTVGGEDDTNEVLTGSPSTPTGGVTADLVAPAAAQGCDAAAWPGWTSRPDRPGQPRHLQLPDQVRGGQGRRRRGRGDLEQRPGPAHQRHARRVHACAGADDRHQPGGRPGAGRPTSPRARSRRPSTSTSPWRSVAPGTSSPRPAAVAPTTSSWSARTSTACRTPPRSTTTPPAARRSSRRPSS